ncbi:MAG: glycosyltransferase family 2 protein [Nitrososphaeria archaeon]
MTTIKKPYIIACIPAYNEEKTIAKVILKTKKYVDKVIVCDDGSTDMTAEIAEALGAEVIRHERNMGKGAAIRSLFKKAREETADIVVTIDADGQHEPDEIPSLLKIMSETNSDIVIGSRFLTEETFKKIPKHRYLGNKLLNLITSIEDVSDTQSGFRIYSRRAVEMINPAEMGFAVDSEILYKAAKLGLKIIEVPVNVEYKVPRPSKRNPIYHGLDVILSMMKQLSMRHPLIIYGLPGIIFLLIALASGLMLIHLFNATRYFSLPLAVITMGFGISGIILSAVAILLWILISLIREK